MMTTPNYPASDDADIRLLRFLVKSAADMNSTLDLDDVLYRVARRVQPFAEHHVFSVMLWNDETKLLERSFVLRHGERVKFDAEGVRLGEGVCGRAAATRCPVRVDDVRSEPSFTSTVPEVEIRSEMAIPLVFQDKLIGVVDVESEDVAAFTEQHEGVMLALAFHIATAIANAQLYERTCRGERRLERDLATAREIQRGLLLTRSPEVRGLEIGTAYLPAADLGGDFYDFLSYGHDRLAVAIGDVAGKGTPAALYGSLAIGVLRGQVVERLRGPAEMLEYLNERLGMQSIDNRYVAMAYAVFDSQKSTVTMANGGFSRPMLLRSRRVEALDVRGLPLGLLPGSRYAETTVELRSGDVVAFCSDGLVEAVNGYDEPFGGDDLEDILCSLGDATAQQIADGVLRASTAYVGVREAHPDDRSVVVVKMV